MPSLYYRVEATGKNVLDIVTQQVVTGLLDELDLTDILKDSVYLLQSFSAYSQYDDGSGAISLNKNRCDVEVTYIMDKAQVPWPVETPYTTTAYGLRADKIGTHTPILIDTDAGILMEHYTVACGIDMNFTLNFQTFDDAAKTFDTIQSKYKGTLIQTPFDISFSYPVSMAMYKYLMSVYQAKTDYTNKQLIDYINDKKVTEISFDVRKTQLTDPNADQELMVRCQELSCLALLTMDQKEPEVQRVEQLPESFLINFSLQFQFGRPSLIAIHTPVSVDNTVLPFALFENITNTYHYNPYVTGVYSDLMVNEFMRRSYGNYRHAEQIVRIPIYDDWFTTDHLYQYYEYRPFVIAHFTLDGTTTTIDLKLLDDVQLHSIVQEIIRDTGNDVFDYGGLFHIGVFANNLRLDKELVSIDDDLILTINSNRTDQQYHFVISETTAITKTDPKWDETLIKYRYFFPMTIERNLNHLIKKRYFYIAYDNSLLSLISKLMIKGQLKALLTSMIAAGEDTNEIYSYTQNAAQLADYLVYTKSQRTNYTIPKVDPNDPDSSDITIIDQYYEKEGGYYVLKGEDGKPLYNEDGSFQTGYTPLPVPTTLPLLLNQASFSGRSLFVAFVEQCLIAGYLTLDTIPEQYIRPNQTMYPYTPVSGGYYGFNTPLRVLEYNIRPERRTE